MKNEFDMISQFMDVTPQQAASVKLSLAFDALAYPGCYLGDRVLFSVTDTGELQYRENSGKTILSEMTMPEFCKLASENSSENIAQTFKLTEFMRELAPADSIHPTLKRLSVALKFVGMVGIMISETLWHIKDGRIISFAGGDDDQAIPFDGTVTEFLQVLLSATLGEMLAANVIYAARQIELMTEVETQLGSLLAQNPDILGGE